MTGWYEFAGIVMEIGFASKATPEVLAASSTFAAREYIKQAYLRLKLWMSRSNTKGLRNVITNSSGSSVTTRVLPCR